MSLPSTVVRDPGGTIFVQVNFRMREDARFQVTH